MSNSDEIVIRRSRVPIYRTIQTDIQRQILSGDLQRGSWLASEANLQREYGASQTSVRRALLELEQLGLIERFQGRGSVITSNEVRATTTMLGLGEELRQRGYNLTAKLITNAEVKASDETVRQLGLSANSSVRHIERVYATSSSPLVFLCHYLLRDLVNDFDQFGGDSLYGYLLVRGAAPEYAQERVFAANLDPRQAGLLCVPEGTAALVRERRSFDNTGRVVEFTRYVLRSDKYHLKMNLRAVR